ncbi:MAG: NADP-dependent oxidoreductase [Leptospira sp.]|nr:NADP-dependent oxidoreductase [Leptospira sp.]
MKAVIIRKYGKVDVMEYTENFPVPAPGPDEIQVELRSASVNPIDWKIMEGGTRPLLKFNLPIALGNDGAGVVSAVGANAKKFKVGDEVFLRTAKPVIGTFAEFISIKEDAAALKPKSLSFDEAASLPLVALTSWQALCDKAGIKKGDKVLIHAGAGGVGSIAIQLAKIFGAYVATTASEKNSELLKGLGADLVIDYRKEDFSKILKDYDIVFDTMGGEIQAKSFSVLKKGGILVSILGIPEPSVAKEYGLGWPFQFLFKLLNMKPNSNAKKYGVQYKHLLMKANGSQLEKIASLVEEKKIKPLIDKVYSLEKTKEAFEYCMQGHARGKVIIRIK